MNKEELKQIMLIVSFIVLLLLAPFLQIRDEAKFGIWTPHSHLQTSASEGSALETTTENPWQPKGSMLWLLSILLCLKYCSIGNNL